MSSDHELAVLLAEEAGRALREAHTDLFEQFGDDRLGLKDAADALAQNVLAAALAKHRPGDAVLSEEAPDDHVRLGADRVWIIDPLDGTREYAHRGRPDWAVHVALWERSADGLTAGAVVLPDQDTVLSTAHPTVGEPSPLSGRPLRIVVSGSRTPVALDQIVDRLGAEVARWGSAGAKAARVITGVDDVYLHDSDLNEWDAAAPVVVAQAHGLISTALDGAPLRFNKSTPINGSLLMARPEAHALVLAALAELT